MTSGGTGGLKGWCGMSEVRSRAVCRRGWHAAFVVLHLVIAAGAVGAFAFSARWASAETAERSTNARIYACATGEWGRVFWHYVHIEAPDWIVADTLLPHSQPSWCFPNATQESLRTFLLNVGADPDAVTRWLQDRRAIMLGPESITLFPSVQDVEALGEASRIVLYRELAKSPINEYHANPIYILDASIDEWIGLRNVRPEIRDVIKRLIYRRDDVLCFSDLSVLMSYAHSDAEAHDLAKLGTRRRAVMAFLHVGPNDDFDALASYWSAAYRRKDVLPILSSISQLPGGGQIGLSHLMPAQPRKLIYTYPTLDLATTGRLPDCHWSTFNFFSFHPQNIYLDLRLAADRLLEGYSKVAPPYKYGDALIFLNADGNAVHSCTYLCDDLVFTKNGEPISAPWIIAQLHDVRRLYSPMGVVDIQGFRRRWEQER